MNSNWRAYARSKAHPLMIGLARCRRELANIHSAVDAVRRKRRVGLSRGTRARAVGKWQIGDGNG